MATGRIKAVNERGFAFITTADGQDVFLHSSDCEGGSRMFDVLSVGDVVEFEFVEPRPPKGARAQRVRYPEPKEVSMSDSKPQIPPTAPAPHPARPDGKPGTHQPTPVGPATGQ